MVRFSLLLILVLLSRQLLAQSLTGKVLDIFTDLPVSATTIKGRLTTITDAAGNFELKGVYIGDTIRITHIGYKPYFLTVKSLTASIKIAISQNSVVLQEVAIKSSRNNRLDSLKNRRDFAAAFAYRGAGFNDIFILKKTDQDPQKPDVHRGNNPYSASSLLKVDLLQVASFLTRSKSAPTKLKKALLADEAKNYVDRAFSKERVASITKLEGDSLTKFMANFRPSFALAKSLSDYEMIQYIKENFMKFAKVKS